MMTTAWMEQTESATPVLTAADRCDQCGARAWVKVTLNSGELLFCAHHANRHMESLRETAVMILDERHLLTED